MLDPTYCDLIYPSSFFYSSYITYKYLCNEISLIADSGNNMSALLLFFKSSPLHALLQLHYFMRTVIMVSWNWHHAKAQVWQLKMSTVFFRWIKADDIATQKCQTDKMTFTQKSSWVTFRRQVGLIENAPNDTIRQLRQNLLKLSRIQWCKIWLFLSIFTLKSLLIFKLSLDTVISEKMWFSFM